MLPELGRYLDVLPRCFQCHRSLLLIEKTFAYIDSSTSQRRRVTIRFQMDFAAEPVPGGGRGGGGGGGGMGRNRAAFMRWRRSRSRGALNRHKRWQSNTFIVALLCKNTPFCRTGVFHPSYKIEYPELFKIACLHFLLARLRDLRIARICDSFDGARFGIVAGMVHQSSSQTIAFISL